MVQGLFDDTEDKSQPEKEADETKKSVFSDDVLFEITRPNHQKAAVEEPSPENVVNVAESKRKESVFAAAKIDEKNDAAVEKAAAEPSPNDPRFEEVMSPPLSGEAELETAAEAAPPYGAEEIEKTAVTLPSDQTAIEGENSPANEIDETDVQKNSFAEPEINISFSEPQDSFSAVEPIIETEKKDEPMLFQMQHTPELPEDTARKTGLALSAGIALFVAVVFMMIIGWFADLLLGTSPWGLVCGIVIGSIIGFYQFFRTTSQILK